MKSIRYLLDENVDPLYRDELLQREPSMIVRRVGDTDAPDEATSDADVLVWCEKNNFVLVTSNRCSMPACLDRHMQQRLHAPSIIELNDNMSIRQTIEALWLTWTLADEKDHRDKILFLP
jgi:hypothetical protein